MTDIILPTYNPTQKIYEAINSIIVQTDKEWHLHIIDDASDNEIIEEVKNYYADFGTKISFYKNITNRRAAACRNLAIKNGKGKFIAFIDQDDVWCSDKLEKQIKAIKNKNLDVIHGNLKLINEKGDIVFKNEWTKENSDRRDTNWSLPHDEIANQLLVKPNIRIISSLVTRKVFEKIGGFKEEFFGGEDETFWVELAVHGKIGFIDDIVFHRRIHDFNTVNVYKKQRLNGYLKAVSYLEKKYAPLLERENINKKKHNLLLRKLNLEISEKNRWKSIVAGFNILFRFPVRTLKHKFYDKSF